MAWLYILGYSTYGAGCTATFAPEYRNTTTSGSCWPTSSPSPASCCCAATGPAGPGLSASGGCGVAIAAACLANLAFVVFGLIGLRLTGYAFDASFTEPTAWAGRIVVVGAVALAAGCAGYVIARVVGACP